MATRSGIHLAAMIYAFASLCAALAAAGSAITPSPLMCRES